MIAKRVRVIPTMRPTGALVFDALVVVWPIPEAGEEVDNGSVGLDVVDAEGKSMPTAPSLSSGVGV